MDWSAMKTFVRHLSVDSATGQELYPEYAAWASRTKTNAILADIFDQLAQINANLVAIGSGEAAKQPKPYPRLKPKEAKSVWHFGRGTPPPPELSAWLEEKRKKKKCQ